MSLSFTAEAVRQIIEDSYYPDWDGDGYVPTLDAWAASEKIVELHEQSED